MLSTNDLILQYEEYTDEQLYHVHSNPGDYSPEAQEALQIVIDKKGGLDKLTHRVKNRNQITNEINRIGAETAQMLRKDIDIDFIRTMMTSPILPAEKVQVIIDNVFAEVDKEKEDKKIKPRTIFGGLLATILATAIGSIYWTVITRLMPPTIPLIILALLVIGLVLICYGIIKAITRQSKQNVVVFIASAISVVLSLVIGYGIASIA
jgi:hypothetical protein